MSGVRMLDGYVPGCIGRVAELHGTYYHSHWSFGLFFEAKVATELSQFLRAYNHDRDGFWTVNLDNRIEGCIAIDGSEGEVRGSHLRWFIISETLRGRGWGRRLLNTALAFCREKASRKVFLWTFQGLDAARHLYETFGFELVEEKPGSGWGTEVREQRFECLLDRKGGLP